MASLVEGLRIPVGFAMLGASNPVMLQGQLPEHQQQILSALDAVIDEMGGRAPARLPGQPAASVGIRWRDSIGARPVA